MVFFIGKNFKNIYIFFIFELPNRFLFPKILRTIFKNCFQKKNLRTIFENMAKLFSKISFSSWKGEKKKIGLPITKPLYSIMESSGLVLALSSNSMV